MSFESRLPPRPFSPDCLVYHPRAHWAIEALLGSPEFNTQQYAVDFASA